MSPSTFIVKRLGVKIKRTSDTHKYCVVLFGQRELPKYSQTGIDLYRATRPWQLKLSTAFLITNAHVYFLLFLLSIIVKASYV
jgi:hypothetical protein